MKIYKILNIIKPVFIILAMLICLIWVERILSMFSKQDLFDVKFTNIAAALFFALANVCFSWARSLKEERHEISIRKLNRISFACIFTSVFFILSSFSNYIIISGEGKGINVNVNPIYLSIIAAKYVTLIIAFLLGMCIIWQLFREGWQLLVYEYALISDTGHGHDSRDEKMPKRLSLYDKKKRLLECIRKNEFSEEKLENGALKFNKGNVEIIFQDQMLLKLMHITFKHYDGPGIVADVINTSNIHIVNNWIQTSIDEHKGDSGQLQLILFTEKL